MSSNKKKSQEGKTAYCRSCNRDFEVHQETETSFIELEKSGGTRRLHNKRDCDV